MEKVIRGMAMTHRAFWLAMTVVVALALVGNFASAQNGITWRATYYPHRFLDHGPSSVTRQEGGLSFNWGKGKPGGMPDSFPADNFSVRFDSSFNFAAGKYRFELRFDDEVNFYIDGQLVIETFDKGRSGATLTAERDLSAGTHNLRVDYRESVADAYVHFSWSRVDAQQPGAGAPAATAVPTPFVYVAQKVKPQPAKADGSIIHVVQTGDTVNAIAVAYLMDPADIISCNELPGNGRWIYPQQELKIRHSSCDGDSGGDGDGESGDGNGDSSGEGEGDDGEGISDIRIVVQTNTTSTPTAETTATPTSESAAVLVESDEDLKPVSIEKACLEALRGSHETEYDMAATLLLNRFESTELNVRGVIPNDWEGEPLGVVTRGQLMLDPTAIIHHIEPELDFNEFVREVLPRYGFDTDLPPATCIEQISTTDFWLFYTFENQQMPLVGEVSQVLALLERNGVSMIAMLAPKDDFVAVLETAFLPAIWNFERGDKMAMDDTNP